MLVIYDDDDGDDEDDDVDDYYFIIIIISYWIKVNFIFMIVFLMKENKVNERKFYK